MVWWGRVGEGRGERIDVSRLRRDKSPEGKEMVMWIGF